MNFLSFFRENLRWVAGGFLMCLCSSFGQTFFIALYGGEIRAEYGLSHGGFGGLYMAATLASAMTLPLLGRIVDHLSVARCVLVIVPMLALACLSMALSHSVLVLAVVLYLLRLFGQGMMTHTSMTAMGRWFSAQRGRAVSLATTGHQCGEALFPLIFIMLAGVVGWRMSWVAASLVLLFVALPAIYWLMRVDRFASGKITEQDAFSGRQWQRHEVLRDPLFWVILSGVLAPAFIGTTIFFHQAYLTDLRAWPTELFARAFVLMALMTVICALLAGWLVDRLTAVKLLPLFLIPLALSALTLAQVERPEGLYLAMLLMGVSYGFSSTLFGALWPEVYGTRHLGGIRSITVALMVLSSAIGPGLTGVLIDAGVAYSQQLLLMSAYCLASALAMRQVATRLQKRVLGVSKV